ncbi:MAG: hypothetical protein K1X86_05520 [Ignavibacteria bacterium]|nr:hypothetical protein [Ignavibacteria bacterium]
MKLFLSFLFFIVTTLNTFAQDSTSKGKISGYMFGDVYYNFSRDIDSTIKNQAYGGKQDASGFQFRRIYLTYDYNISKDFFTRFRLEGGRDEVFQNGKIGVFIKDAYIEWKEVFKGSSLIFGIQPTTAYALSEKIWEHRHIEKTIMDLRGIIDSRDFGLSLKGSFDKDEKYSYSVMAGNNSGVKVENDKYKRVNANLTFRPANSFYISAFSDFRTAAGNDDYSKNEFTYSVFFGYKKSEIFTAGAESYYNIIKNYLGKGEDKTGLGLSVFAVKPLDAKLSLFGRYDYFDDNTKSFSKYDSRDLFIFGFDYKPNAHVYISPNFAIEYYERTGGETIKPSVTGRLTIFYEFF